MAYQLQEINKRIRTDVVDFLAECDANYAARVSLAADKILENLERSPIVRQACRISPSDGTILDTPPDLPDCPKRGFSGLNRQRIEK